MATVVENLRLMDRPGGTLRPHAELRFLLGILAPYRPAILGASSLLLLDGVLTLSLPWFAASVARALLDGSVPDFLLLLWLAIMGVQAVLGFGAGLVLGSINARVTADLGSRVYDHMQSLPIGWHQERKRGESLALLTNDVWRISSFLTDTLTPLLPLLFTCAGALVLLMQIQPLIGLAVALGVPALVVVLRLVTRQLRPLADASLHEDAVKHGIAEQNLSTLPIIKAFTREKDESARYQTQGHTVRDLEIRQLRIASALAPAVRWVGAAAVILLLWLGSRGVASGAISAPDLLSLLLYGLLLTHPVGQLAGVYGQIQIARGSAWRLLALFDESPEPDSGRQSIAAVRGEITFHSVAFSYPGRAPVFTALDWHVRAGETVAITGFNGAGKSTLAWLIMRFIDPQAGQITLDGIDLRELRLHELRAHIGLVSQNVLLFNASAAHNIAYGRYAASQEQIEIAARAANAHEFISRLPQGYDTVIGDEGVRLSGGQKQRIALARALLKDPAILILDEATAMFDPEGERGFIAECHDLLHSRTVLLITHRPASLALADRIFRLENGQLRELREVPQTS